MGHLQPQPSPVTHFRAGHIRLLKFLPGNITTVGTENVLEIQPEGRRIVLIPCELIYTSLYDAPPYVALSYAWDDPSHTRRIVIND
jgi:hypothetical protein